MGKSLFIEPYSGISGDMFLGALAPLLNMEDAICALPDQLHLPNVTVQFEDVIRSTIQCRKATVRIDGESDHEHTHDHHHDHHHTHGDHHHHHDHDAQHHHHDISHDHHHHHGHEHRAYSDIVKLINHAHIPESAKLLALEMFRILGEAEAAMHGMELDDVHFHEVGGEDSIIDIVGAALLIDRLQPDQVFSNPICVGTGFVKTAHGRLPVPAPATQSVLKGMPTFAGPIEKEMTTPTGAVILKILNPSFEVPTLITESTGMGAGTRDLNQPNALRVSLASPDTINQETVELLQTNLDNMSGEDLGADFVSALLEQGALDAWLTPITMKKGRPGQKLEVLCANSEEAEQIGTWILSNSGTLGIRRFSGSRQILEREQREENTPYGTIRVKVHKLPDGTERLFPEYEDCRKAAQQHHVTVSEVRNSVR